MSPELFTTLLGVAAAIYFIAAMITLGHMIAGPNSLDRLVSLESMTAMLQGMLAAFMAWTLDTSAVYPMLIIALLGFLSSLSAAKFRVPDDDKSAAKATKAGKAGRAGNKTVAKAGNKDTDTAALAPRGEEK